MARHLMLLAALAILLPGCATPDHAGPSTTDGTTGYAPLLSSPIRGLSLEEVDAIRTGAGMRLALPAELNGYPGPKHVLELEGNLSLTPEQRTQVQALFDATQAEARAEGEELLRLWRELDAGFREGRWTEESLQEAVAALDAQQGEVRFVHLRAHLRTQEILTPHQVALYNELRGYGGADHGDHPH